MTDSPIRPGKTFGKLSKRQQNILRFIHKFIQERHMSPTIEEIGAATDTSSKSVVTYNLNKLDAWGYITRGHKRQARALGLVIPPPKQQQTVKSLPTKKPTKKPTCEFDRLSERQQAMLRFIHAYIEVHHFSPSIREIGAATNINTISVLLYNLGKLNAWGYISRGSKGQRRAIVVLIAPPDKAMGS